VPLWLTIFEILTTETQRTLRLHREEAQTKTLLEIGLSHALKKANITAPRPPEH